MLALALGVKKKKEGWSKKGKEPRAELLRSVSYSGSADGIVRAAQTPKRLQKSAPGVPQTITNSVYGFPSFPGATRLTVSNLDVATQRPDLPPLNTHPYAAFSIRSDTKTAGRSEACSPRTETVPPPYSPHPGSSLHASSIYSRDSDGVAQAASDPDTATTSGGGAERVATALRVHTKGAELDSGFDYHPALFELSVHPAKWQAFTTQVVNSTKFDLGDHAKYVAAAAATAMTGAVISSVLVGKGMKRRVQENKVKAGLADMSDGGLGDLLHQWNEHYFHARGLAVDVELSESALKRPDGKSKLIRREALWYGNREERDRKKIERKFVIVVTRLVDEEGGELLQESHELAGAPSLEAMVSELPGEDAAYMMAEMPGEKSPAPAELTGDPWMLPGSVSLGYSSAVAGCVELDSTTDLLAKTRVDTEDRRE